MPPDAGGAGGLESALAFGVVPESADEAGIHRTDIAAEAEVAAAARQDLAQGTRGFGVSRSLAYTVKHIRKGPTLFNSVPQCCQ